MVPFVPQFLMTMMIKRLLVTWQHPEDSMLESGALLVNQDGERFCDEKVSPAREIAVANQAGKYAYMLLDRKLIEKFSAWPNFISTAQEIGYAYVDDYLRLRPDVTVKGETLVEVAGKRDIPVEKLAQAAAEGGLSEGPWVLMGPAKAYFTNTEGGVAINTRFEALDEDGTPIPGLYAIGQNGLSGLVLWGHGLHINWAMTSGRMVGKQLAKEQIR
jgi:succinate dehydrogenase/fumarate reductase flavoprotein subunit